MRREVTGDATHIAAWQLFQVHKICSIESLCADLDSGKCSACNWEYNQGPVSNKVARI